MVAVNTVVSNALKARSIIEAVVSRDTLVANLERTILTGQSLSGAIAASPLLAACVEIGVVVPPALDCVNRSGASRPGWLTFTSAGDLGRTKTIQGYPGIAFDPISRVPLGRGPTPVFLRLDGTPCGAGVSSATATCPLASYVVFEPLCASGAPSCVTAAVLRFRYLVKQEADSRNVKGPMRLTAVSGSLDVPYIHLFTAQRCPAGGLPRGRNADGTIVCDTRVTCTAGQALSGINPDGTPDCVDLAQNIALAAQRAAYATTAAQAAIRGGICPVDQWVLGIYSNGTPRCGPLP